MLLGDTVTVSMTSENRVTFSVDGAPVATETDGNIYTASFVVTGNHAVTYEYSYAVSGKIAKPDYATADLTSTVLKFTSGETAEFGGAVNANGEYTVYLPAGEYAMRAEHAGFMPASGGAVTVTSVAVENANAAFTLVRPENMNGLTYDESTGKLSNKGDIVTCFGSGSDFVVTTYVDKITTEWKAAGLVLRDASTNKFVKIAIRKTESGFDLFSHLGDGYMDFPAIADPFTQNGERAKLTVVRRSASLAVFINDEFVAAIGISASTAVHHWGTPDTVLTDYLTPGGEYSFGLGTCDNTNATFSEWGYGLKFDDLYAVAGRTLTLPEGVTAKVGETEITDGKAILGDTVTVSMTSENLVTFSVDGVAVTTDHNDNVYTASFTVTGNHTVTYEEAYAVSGAVTSEVDGVSAFEAAVKVLDESGATVTDCTAGTDGKFTFVVRNGVYKVYAIVDGKAASLAYTVKIANGAIAEVNGESTALNIALTKRLASSAFGYDPNTGSLTGQDRTAGYLFGAEVDYGEPYVLTATVRRQSATNWPAIGLLIGQGGDNYMQFAIRKCCPDSGVYYDFFLRRAANGETVPQLYKDYKFGEALTADAFGADDTVKLTIAYYGGNYYIYMDDALTFTISETTVLDGVALKDAIGTGRIKLGLFSEQEGTFTDWGYEVGKTAAAKLLTRTITLPEGVTAKAGETEVTDGKVLLGDTVTVSIESANLVTFSVDGVTVMTDHNENVYTASFTVTGNHTVTYEEAYAVSGTISYPDYATADLASTVLKFIKDGAATEFTDVVGASGEYSVYLPAGEYTVRAEHAGFMPVVGDTIAVTNAAVENVGVAFTLVKPENMNGLTYDEGTGKLSNSGDIVTCFGSGSDFVVTTYVDKITTEWKAAGLVLRDASTNKFVKIAIRKTESGFDLFSHLGDGYMDFPAIADPFTQNGERAKLTVERIGATIKVYVNDELKSTIAVADTTVVKHWGSADTKITDYLSADGEYRFGFGTCDGTNAIFSEWSYKLK